MTPDAIPIRLVCRDGRVIEDDGAGPRVWRSGMPAAALRLVFAGEFAAAIREALRESDGR